MEYRSCMKKGQAHLLDVIGQPKVVSPSSLCDNPYSGSEANNGKKRKVLLTKLYNNLHLENWELPVNFLDAVYL